MKKLIITILLAGFGAGFLSACAGGGSGRVIYHNNYGYGGWWGHRTWIDRRPIIVPPPDSGDKEAVNLPVYPDNGGPGLEAMPHPVEPPPEPMMEPMAEPMMDMDMGMPEMMDFGE